MRFGIGMRVCRHITNSYKDKHKGVPYDKALLLIKKDAKKRLVEVNRAHRFAVAEFVRVISQNVGGLNKAEKITGFATSELPTLNAFIMRSGYLKSIIKACEYLKPEQLKEWVEYEF